MGEITEARVFIPEEEKGYQCEVILDSISSEGVRLVTMRWKYPRFVHAEACRHRAFSRSVGSSRAIPTARLIAMVEQDPLYPVYWGRNQGGMQADEELTEDERFVSIAAWDEARKAAVDAARRLHASGAHKQIVNRVLEPFMWVTEVVTATDWANFFALRCHPAAQPEIRKIAEMAREVFDTSKPRLIPCDVWHLPFTDESDWTMLRLEDRKKVSAARVARTSYRTHEGKLSTLEEDFKLYGRLVGAQPIHASPTEHLATPLSFPENRIGNLRGWRSHRYELEGHTIRD